jgi:hypothetical protein
MTCTVAAGDLAFEFWGKNPIVVSSAIILLTGASRSISSNTG